MSRSPAHLCPALAASFLAATLPALAGAASGEAAAPETERPVFWPAWYQPRTPVPPAGPSPLDQVEFCGVLSVRGETFITLLNTALSRTILVPLGGESEGIGVTDFRSETGTIRAVAGGHERVLVLRESHIVPPPPEPVRHPHPRFGGLRRRGAPDDVAREIARRRELRRQLLEAGKSEMVSTAASSTPAQP